MQIVIYIDLCSYPSSQTKLYFVNMSSSSLSSAISTQPKYEFQEKYDVFLSFRGEDTRDTFSSYLYAALSANKISTFMDCQLEGGDEISSTLKKAIEESKIWVIIFSQNFASSTWCLNELVHILECKKRNEQTTVLPIFYGVDPATIRKQEGSYGVAFAELEKRFADRMDKVHQWRTALTEASNLCGLNSKLFRPECKLVEEIVKLVSLKLTKYLSKENSLRRNLIGIEEKIHEIELLLSIGSTDVRIVGIWGMGGIGKTTLASVVYQRLSYSHFKGRCFVRNVREEYARHGPNHLRKKLLSELLNDEAILRMDTPFVTSSFILDRLKRKKVFIVLDDVDSSIHLDALVEGCNQLASGSRIIVTSRNKQVLKKVADDIYKVERLNHNESLELFHLHAFCKNNFQAIDDEMVLEVTSYANGNPLALKVLGSFLCSRSEKDWENSLKKLKRIPNPEIQDVLRISYDGLDDQGIKDTFLDIACLFNSKFDRDIAGSILDDGNSFVNIEISVLIDKSLIESNQINNVLWMHDLIRQTGRTIVRDEQIQASNRRRLCNAKEFCNAIENQMGTTAVKLISLDMSEIKENVKVCRAAFSNMHDLQILKIFCCDDIGGSEFVKVYSDNIAGYEFKLLTPKGLDSYLSNKLRYLQWDFYPLNSLPSKFNPQNLVQLVLRGSRVEKLWNYKVQSLPLLRMIDLSYSKFLSQLPDLSQAPNLESINLEGCTGLVQVFSSLQNLDKLTYLNLNGCSKLRDFFRKVSKSTGHMDVVAFGGITKFSNNIFQLKNFTFLKTLNQSFTRNLSLYSSQSHISQKIPLNLTKLLLSGTPIEAVPPSIWYLSSLQLLDLSYCTRLKSLPTSICKLKSLDKLYLGGCLNLDKFPEILEPMEPLTHLKLDETGIKELPESIENLVSLQILYIAKCKEFESLPNSLCNLKNLEMLCLQFCSKLQKLPPLPPILLTLGLDGCERLKYIPELPSLLLVLSARCCTSLEYISNWRDPSSQDVNTIDHKFFYGYFDFDGCEKLDQNIRNSIPAARRSLYVLIRTISTVPNSHDFLYPGVQTQKLILEHETDFNGTAIKILSSWPYAKNLLSLAIYTGAECHKRKYHVSLCLEDKLNLLDYQTIVDGDVRLYQHHGSALVDNMVIADHVFMWYATEPVPTFPRCLCCCTKRCDAETKNN